MPQNVGSSSASNKPKLLDQVRDVIRRKHFSMRTERSYVDWIRRFILFHDKRHPREMAEIEVTQFLTHLARECRVAASTQNQALSALLFLYKQVLKQEIGWLAGVERAKRPARLPVVLNRDEVHRLFAQLHGIHRLMAGLLYGSGLRLMECVRLRVKDVDLGYLRVTVREGKGGKDRLTMLPVNLAKSLERHLQKVRAQHEEDLDAGLGAVYLPGSTRAKVSQRRQAMAVAISLPLIAPVDRSACGNAGETPPSHRRKRFAGCGQTCSALCGDFETGDVPHAPALVCHPSPRRWL
jgi:integron integrase